MSSVARGAFTVCPFCILTYSMRVRTVRVFVRLGESILFSFAVRSAPFGVCVFMSLLSTRPSFSSVVFVKLQSEWLHYRLHI